MNEGISFQAALEAIRTTKDGGWIVSFALSQSEVQSIMQLSILKDTLLSVGIVHAKEPVLTRIDQESEISSLDALLSGDEHG